MIQNTSENGPKTEVKNRDKIKKDKTLEKRSFSANDNAGHLGSCGERAVSRAWLAAPAAGQG